MIDKQFLLDGHDIHVGVQSKFRKLISNSLITDGNERVNEISGPTQWNSYSAFLSDDYTINENNLIFTNLRMDHYDRNAGADDFNEYALRVGHIYNNGEWIWKTSATRTYGYPVFVQTSYFPMISKSDIHLKSEERIAAITEIAHKADTTNSNIRFLFNTANNPIVLQNNVYMNSTAKPKFYILYAEHEIKFGRDHTLNISTVDYQKYAIAMMDLDKFKIINDTYGHDIGDEVLKSVSAVLKSSIREYDKLIRYGGEEFLLYIAMRDLNHHEINELLNRIRQNIEAISIQTGLITIHPTISIGINSYTSHFKSEHDAISMADKMLYQAKQTGRNKITAHIPNKAVTENSIHFLSVHHVKEAIEEKRIFCEYQPIVHLGINQIIGYEALIRIRDRDSKIYYPGMFLSNIAHSNVYKELTMELLRMNFKKVQDERCCLSINLNITDILDDDIYHIIINHLTNTDEDAEYLTFELLEEEQITNLDELKKRVDSIRTAGSKISLDDFGSGYSNFSHVFALNVDTIKIDGSLIKDIASSEISYKLVESIVAFALASEKKVIAEYIHSLEILEIVKKLGISHGQGFYLGKPSETLAITSAHL